MPSSSLFLRSSTTLFSAFYLLSSAAASSSTHYTLDTSYSGDSFYDGWDFWDTADPTHGFVTYLDQGDAETAGLLQRGSSGSNIIAVDSTNVYNHNVNYYGVNGLGRPSVRISTEKTWNHGLFIADIKNMPGGVCGTWPAFWTLGDGTWPYHGEIDILEGANNQNNVLSSLHTGGTCSIAGTGETGSLQATNCTYDVATGANSAGCGVSDPDTSSYGTTFNQNDGGVYAMEWTSQAIKIWFWSRGTQPSNVLSSSPDPSGWGLPDANFAGSCDIDSNFKNHQIIVDATFCGDWAGNTWGDSCQAQTGYSTCQDYVANNPEAFSSMYWDINSINVFTLTAVSSTTTSSSTPTSTTSSTSHYTPTSSSSSTTYGHSSSSAPFQNTTTTWPTTSRSSSSTSSSSRSTTSALTTGWPAGELLGCPNGGGVEITRTIPGHAYSRPSAFPTKSSSTSTVTSIVIDSSTAWYEWDPSTSSSSSLSVSSSWREWDPKTTSSSTLTSTITLSSAWPDWTESSGVLVSTLTVSPFAPSSSSVSPTYDAWSSATVSPTQTSATVSPTYKAWSSAASQASYNATSAGSWVATYTGAASSNIDVGTVVYTAIMVLGMLAMVL